MHYALCVQIVQAPIGPYLGEINVAMLRSGLGGGGVRLVLTNFGLLLIPWTLLRPPVYQFLILTFMHFRYYIILETEASF